MSISSHIASMRLGLAAAAGLLHPPLCLVCRQPPPGRDDRLCGACRSAMRRVPEDHPLRLEAAFRLAAGGLVDDVALLFLFEHGGPLQQALHLLKYSGMHSLGVMFGRDLGAILLAAGGRFAADLLMPVPLHPARLRERGYNQSERICAGIREVTGTPLLTGTLLRTRNTPSQTALPVRGREENVRGAFRVAKRRAPLLEGRNVLLVDDVMTTGATLRACAEVARSAGATRVVAAAAAVAEHSAGG